MEWMTLIDNLEESPQCLQMVSMRAACMQTKSWIGMNMKARLSEKSELYSQPFDRFREGIFIVCFR